MNTEQRNQKGITLIELIIVVAIIGGLLLAAGFVLTQGLRAWSNTSSAASLQDQLRSIEDRMSRDLRGSRTVDASSSPPSTFRLYFSPSASIDTGTYYEYNSSDKILYRALSGSRLPISEGNIISMSPDPWRVTVIGTIGQGTITVTIYNISVSLGATANGRTFTTSFSVTPRTWK
jgi:prepilin-type N-terminal cleavage/methylation domain-containing protein